MKRKLTLPLVTLMFVGITACQASRPATSIQTTSLGDWKFTVGRLERIEQGMHLMVPFGEPQSIDLGKLVGCLSLQQGEPATISCPSVGTLPSLTMGVKNDSAMILVHCALENKGNTTLSFSMKDVTIVGSDGRKAAAQGIGGDTGLLVLIHDLQGWSDEITVDPGQWNIRLLFTVPKDLTGLNLRFGDLPPIQLTMTTP
jgi:hypothetical protein